MATLTAILKLTSTDATTDSLSLSVSDSLSVEAPLSGPSRLSVGTSSAVNILTSGGNTAKTYVYAKNLDATNFVELKDDSGNTLIELGPGEICFLPVQGGAGLEAQADTAACEIEYGFWTAQ